MNKNIFINIGFDTAIKKYLLYTNENNKLLESDFLVYVIFILIYIYGENSIIKPYLKKTENGDRDLVNNLRKYKTSEKTVNKFLDDLNCYLEKDNYNKVIGQTKNAFFTYVQEDLIDMFFDKAIRNNYKDDEYMKFKEFIFSNNSINNQRRIMNEKYAINPQGAINHFNKKMYNKKYKIDFKEVKKEVLDPKIYEAFNLSTDKIEKLDQENLTQINQTIYSYFKINPLENKAEEKLKKRVDALFNKKFKLSNNSGKTNIALFLSIFAVIVIIGVILGIKILRGL